MFRPSRVLSRLSVACFQVTLTVVVVLIIFGFDATSNAGDSESGCDENVQLYSADCNGDGILSLADPLCILTYMFVDGEPPLCLADEPPFDDIYVNEDQRGSVSSEMVVDLSIQAEQIGFDPEGTSMDSGLVDVHAALAELSDRVQELEGAQSPAMTFVGVLQGEGDSSFGSGAWNNGIDTLDVVADTFGAGDTLFAVLEVSQDGAAGSSHNIRIAFGEDDDFATGPTFLVAPIGFSGGPKVLGTVHVIQDESDTSSAVSLSVGGTTEVDQVRGAVSDGVDANWIAEDFTIRLDGRPEGLSGVTFKATIYRLRGE